MLTTTVAELEAAYADCVKRRGREVADDIVKGLAGVENLADVPGNRRFFVTAALERQPAEGRASTAQTLDDIRERAFANMRGK
jgi:hypothetical protein